MRNLILPYAEEAIAQIHAGDDVIIYPNASILGDITVGNGSIIVSNTLVTEDIPERMLVKPSANGISIRPL